MSAPSRLPAIRVYWTGVRLIVNLNSLVVFLGYEYSKGVLKLRFYRSFVWPSTSPLEVRVLTPDGGVMYVRERVLPSRVFTVTFYVEVPEAIVEVLMDGEVVLRTRLVLAGA